MELIKRNIHMDRTEKRASGRFTLEEDFNIPDTKADVAKLIYDKAEVKVEEVKPTGEYAVVRGSLWFSVLYQGEGDAGPVCLDNKILFEEKVFGANMDQVRELVSDWEIMDFTVNIINSRKLNVQAIVKMDLVENTLYDEEVSRDIQKDIPVEYRKKRMEIAQVGMMKNDVFRFKEEIDVAQGAPNIFELLWRECNLLNVEFKCLEDKISLQGEVALFCLYKNEDEEQTMQTIDTVIPFSGMLDCHGCREDMISEIGCNLSHKSVEVREDMDGEDRVIGMECALDLQIKLYEEEMVEMLSDVYGVTKEVETVQRPTEFTQLLMRGGGKMKYAQKVRIRNADEAISQIVHVGGNIQIDDTSIMGEEIHIRGTLNVKMLYKILGVENGFGCVREMLPFEYTLEVPGITEKDVYRIVPVVEQIGGIITGTDEVEIKAMLYFKIIAFQRKEEMIITDVVERELNKDRISELPGMAVYIVQEGDNLWNIGKRYYVPIARLKEVNKMASDEVKIGDKLLIVKGIS